MKILTCNLRTSAAQDGNNSWKYRKEICRDIIQNHKPHILCFQEMHRDQFVYLQSEFSQFETFWENDRPENGHPVNAIFYLQEFFTFKATGSYWLSETPHVAGSKSWDSDCIRLACWVCLETKEKKAFRVINTHLDHISQLAREHQAEVINKEAATFHQSYPQLLTGDMNCDYTNKAIQSFLNDGWRDSYEAVHKTLNPGHTYHEFLGPAYNLDDIGKMDWIFVRGTIHVQAAEIITNMINNRYPSDHYFVSAEIDFL